MRRIKLLAVALTACALLTNANAAQELKSLDVMGLKVGMKPDEVISIIKSVDPRARMTVQKSLNSEVVNVFSEFNNDGNTEKVNVAFGNGGGTAFLIKREVNNFKTGISTANLRQALEEKYGQSLPLGQGPLRFPEVIYARGSDLLENLNTQCIISQYDSMSFRDKASNLACTQSLYTSVAVPKAPGVYVTYSLMLVDYLRYRKEAALASSNAQQAQQQKNQRVQDAAKTARPAL